MSDDDTRSLRAKADVKDGHLVVISKEGQSIQTPADYSGRLATLLETIADYPHPSTETTGDDDPDNPPFEAVEIDSGANVHTRPVVGRVDVFTAYPDPDPTVYALINGATNMSHDMKVKNQQSATQLGRLFRAIDNGATKVGY